MNVNVSEYTVDNFLREGGEGELNFAYELSTFFFFFCLNI